MCKNVGADVPVGPTCPELVEGERKGPVEGVINWRDGRVVEGGGLENRFPETGRGFESYSLRHEE